ncbi:MAG: pilus assembly protein PilM [Acidobacteria bacterium]|nr:pilus assembly protein PilM [Acidobacteriota bacterium]
MDFKKLFRIGTGCGIEIRGDDLLVIAAKSRPNGVSVIGRKLLAGFRERPPREWGGEYAAFLKDLGLSHLAATVTIPRGDVIVRQIQLPPVKGKDLAAAIQYQIDTLHPFGEDEVYYSFAPLREIDKTGGELPVGVVIAEKLKIDEYASLFEAAGIPVSAFSVAAAAFFAVMRVRWDKPPTPFLITDFRGDKLEIYGEGTNRPLFSAEFDLSVLAPTRALQLAASDLRLEGDEAAILAVCGERSVPEGAAQDPDSQAGDYFALEGEAAFEQRSVSEILPAPLSAPLEFEIRRDAAALAVALEAACPRLGWRANLLPEARRKSSSRWMYAPTIALGSMLCLLLIAFLARASIQDSSYAAALQAEQARLAATVEKARASTVSIADSRRRIERLQSLERRTETDMRVLAELSELIPDTAWLRELEIDDGGIQITGEAESAAPLLGRLNDSRYLAEAAFSTSLREGEAGQRFQIVAVRREIGPSDQDTPAAPAISIQTATPGSQQESSEPPATLTTVGEQDPNASKQEEEDTVFKELLP